MKLTAPIIAKYAKEEFYLHQEIHRTFAFRDSGIREKYNEWKEACETYHAYTSPLHKYWTEKFASQVRAGNRISINELILFLEVDPFYFRSGYLKERLLKLIKNAPRTEEDDRRLRNVIWNRTTGPNRREYKYYCRLAHKISTPEFRATVLSASLTQNVNAWGKFSYLLKYLPTK